MDYATPTNEWNREARRAAEIMADFRNHATAEKNEDGFMVVIGYALNEVDALHIAWCPKGRVSDALLAVQHGNPHMLALRSWLPATVSDVSAHLKALQKFRTRTCADNWFRKMPQVEAYLGQVRIGIYGAASAEVELKEIKSAPATTLLTPPKKTAKKRRSNKRQAKRRRR
ncbi:MAG: hypothetical protein QM780_15780 [Hyphomicrobium sp.]|uniref:hypothetical protein n=1 Tax=Hyphomicrobium sp. TaxID=82 RepID=UPI0039E66C14